jgi:PmbA protein
MDAIEFNKFKDRLFKAAKETGFADYEIYYAFGESFKVNVYKNEIDSYSVNITKGLGFRGLYKGCMGYAYTEILDDAAIDMLIENAKTNAIIIESDDKEKIYPGGSEYQDINCYNESLLDISASEKIELALKMEKMALEKDSRVKDIRYCTVSSFNSHANIINSQGLNLNHKTNGIYAALVPVIKDGDMSKTSFAYRTSRNFFDIVPSDIVKEAVDKALSSIGASTLKTDKYKIILNNEAALDLLKTYSVIFSADRAQKGMSLLKGKEGEIISSKILTIVDDPLLEGEMGSMPFDGEGVACYTKNIIEKGKLTTLLHNLKTASKDGVKTTGNASRPSYSSTIGVSPTNFYIKPNDSSLNELQKRLKNGILIMELEGLHSGANTISGDFSLAAKGFEINNGKIIRPIEQITIAGNFYKMLKDIEGIGKDLKFGLPSGEGCFGSPSLLIRELSVAS